MSKILPPLPRVVLCYLEPLSLLIGAIVPLVSPSFFIPSQLPPTHLHAHQTAPDGTFNILPIERVLTYQVANAYAILSMVGIGVLNTTTEPSVVHAYVVALGIGDVGHIAATAAVMGWEDVVRWREWNATMWGNLGAVVVLFVVRGLYLLGWLGADRVPGERRGKVKRG